MSYYVYMLKSIEKKSVTYVGYTKNLFKRISLHNSGKGAKFTRGRKWRLIYKEIFKSKNQAISREYYIKNNRTKENFSPDYAGAVSIFINSVSKLSKFKKNIKVYGNTNYKNIFPINYVNIPLEKKFLASQSSEYVKKFIYLENKNPSDVIEVHNRPLYINFLNPTVSNYI